MKRMIKKIINNVSELLFVALAVRLVLKCVLQIQLIYILIIDKDDIAYRQHESGSYNELFNGIYIMLMVLYIVRKFTNSKINVETIKEN